MLLIHPSHMWISRSGSPTVAFSTVEVVGSGGGSGSPARTGGLLGSPLWIGGVARVTPARSLVSYLETAGRLQEGGDLDFGDVLREQIASYTVRRAVD